MAFLGDFSSQTNSSFQQYSDNTFGLLPAAFLQTVAGVLAVFMALGVIGNGISVLAIRRLPRPLDANAIFIISLCVADLIFCSTVLPVEASRFANGEWRFGEGILCVVIPFLKYLNAGISLLLIALVSLNRFVLIVLRNVYDKLYRRWLVYMQIAGICLYALMMLLPTLLGIWGRFGYNPKLQTCTVVPVEGSSPKRAFFLLGFLLPLIFILICYSGILVALIRSRRRLLRYSSPGQRRSSPPLLDDNELRVAKMSFTVFAAFIVCQMPVTVIKVKDPEVLYPTLHVLCYLTTYSSAWINPIIYAIMNRTFRRAYTSLLPSFRCRKTGIQEASTGNTAASNTSTSL